MNRLFLVASIILTVSSFATAAIPRAYRVDSNAKSLDPVERSLCGVNDMTPMISEPVKMQEMGTPIGIYEATIDGSTGYCTGTLITKDLFLTAQHCAAKCEDINVTFGFLKEGRSEKFSCKEIIETGDSSYENDYLIIKLSGSPGVSWGWYDVSEKPVPPNSPLLMIHHPQATPMKVSQKNCVLLEEKDNFLMHRCDTQPGSSGSAILLPNYENPTETRVVGVHTLGGCDDTASTSNSGPSMHHLVTISPTLKSLAK